MQNIKFIFDVGVSKKAELYLREKGFDILSIREINHSMKDLDILNLAVKEQRIIVTMDKDFGELVFNSKFNHSGVLLLRMEDAGWQQKIEVLSEIFLTHSAELIGNFSVYQDKKLRIRKALIRS
jgi:predicted nuclease of predicted toxin-antitoxin system